MFLPQDLFCSSLEQEVKDSSLFATCAAQQTFGVSWAVATLPAGEASAIPREDTLNGEVEGLNITRPYMFFCFISDKSSTAERRADRFLQEISMDGQEEKFHQCLMLLRSKKDEE